MRTITLSILLFLAATSVASAGPFDDGLAAYRNGEWAKAYALLKPIAEATTSQTPAAQERMGRMAERGKGTTKDLAVAAKWYEKAAAQGDVLAQGHLGRFYRTGVPGLPRDPMLAAKWSIKAASQGNALAQASLGYMALEGVGGPADPTAAAGWFKRAAEQGDANAMLGLGTLQESGKGVPRDLVQAAKWYALASVDDGENDPELFERAKRQHDTVVKSMSPAQIALADQLAKDFKPAGKR